MHFPHLPAPHLWLGLFFEVIAFALIPVVLLRRKEPGSTIAWILTLVFLPAIGAFLFVAFGSERVRVPARRKREHDAIVRAELLAHAPGVVATPDDSAPLVALPVNGTELELSLFKVGAHLTHGRPTSGNRVAPLFGGNEAYESIGAAIDAARHHVHAEYYLIRNDATGEWFKERLIAAAARGVEVRLLCDGYGCFSVHASYFRALKKAGVRIGTFLPMRTVLLQPVNLRNHRKIVVVDGTVSFTGGLNIGDEYRGQMKGIGEWRDIHMRIEGGAARDLQRVFYQDWFFTTGEALKGPAYFPALPVSPAGAGDGATIAVITSGPDTQNEAIERIFFGAIAGARKRVWMTTPYFVPDQAITVAMELAAMRGVDVRIVLPAHSNHAVTFHAGRSFYEPLLEAGVRVYEYVPGMVHAKTMVVDGAVSLVGSANMDLRSFRLNFEVHALAHDAALAARLEESFQHDLSQSRLVDPAEWGRRGARLRMYEGASRLVSPLL
ncbi:MAG: cardiolipin synthase [Polyangiaceae bacterium]